jgi:transposase
MSCTAVAKVLLLDDDTIRTWHRLYAEEGIEGLASFGYEGSACRLSEAQQDRLIAWITETLPRTTREVGAWIETECGIASVGSQKSLASLIWVPHWLTCVNMQSLRCSGFLRPIGAA